MSALLATFLGAVAGLRTMTAPAVAAWAGHLGVIRLDGTPFEPLATTTAAWIFAALMLGELIADKLPFTPSRTTPGPFFGRVVAGGLAGAMLTTGVGGSAALGAVLGGVGAVAGTLGGYRARTGLVRALDVPDFVVALGEDVVAVGGAVAIVALAA